MTADWIEAAASDARRRLHSDLQARFGPKGWTEFSARLDANHERLFRLLHALYGERYDFAWTLSAIAEAAADGYLKRPGRLRRIDREFSTWLDSAESLWGMTYLDLYAGEASKLVDRIPHLQALGISHLHLLPPYAAPEGANDGGYAVSDYRSLRADLGSITQLRKAIKKLSQESIGVVLDLICNHTSSDHAWAQAAAEGDPYYRDFYFMFPDRRIPDQISPHLRSIFPDRGGDTFTWQEGPQSWVWTTFFPFQWDLNYRNPHVLAAMAAEMLFIANLGVSAIRMDATPFMWKEPGTSCENLPQAHQLLQILRIVADLACPSVQFLSEAIVAPDEVSAFVNPIECRLGYNPLLMTSVWDALATDDVRFLEIALGQRFHLPPGCSWLTYLRSHDDIGWGFDDGDAIRIGVDPRLHRHYLNAFYSGQFPESFARGELFQSNQETGDARISGSLASLAGLEKALEEMDPAAIDTAVNRILCSWAVILMAGGIPLIFLGDETAPVSDHMYKASPDLAPDNRWSHRRGFSIERFEEASSETGPGTSVLSGITGLLNLRRTLAIPPSVPPEPFATGDRGTIGFSRGSITLVANLSRNPAVIDPLERSFDLIRQEPWDGNVLAPYEFRILGAGARYP
ncbi:MAG TPA: alpha-amylase family glycosyl hydrolase [Acidimicrobiia bacterium]|nr:alpha-amylase family glycosyl hydrolase [Acidimicrobiia bacterium]